MSRSPLPPLQSFPQPVTTPRAVRALLFPGILAAWTLALGACEDTATNPAVDPTPSPVEVVRVSGDIAPALEAFRTLLGAPNGGTPGEQPAGRRQINWDGAGANPFNNRNDFPGDFFNNQVRTGAIFSSPGGGLRNDSTQFVEIDPSYAAEFGSFSPTKAFAPVGSPIVEVDFRVAGEAAPALTSGVGIVFSDVDTPGSTWIDLFDAEGSSLGRVTVPVRSDAGGFSFAGVVFDEAIISRIRITLGGAAVAPGRRDVSAGGVYDLVVIDDIQFGEPRRMN